MAETCKIVFAFILFLVGLVFLPVSTGMALEKVVFGGERSGLLLCMGGRGRPPASVSLVTSHVGGQLESEFCNRGA